VGLDGREQPAVGRDGDRRHGILGVRDGDRAEAGGRERRPGPARERADGERRGEERRR